MPENYLSDKYWSFETALEQIESCGFECEAGALSMNLAFQWLKEAIRKGPKFAPGQGVFYEVEAEAGGTKLSKWAHYYVVGVRMDSDTEKRIWAYTLSNDPPAPWHYGNIQHRNVGESKLRLVNPETPKAAE